MVIKHMCNDDKELVYT